jgi:hypothetical protein
VDNILRKLDIESDESQLSTHHLWQQFWDGCLNDDLIPQGTDFVSGFKIPKAQEKAKQQEIVTKKRKASALDDGKRLVQVVHIK